jgi:hypothetical protein
MGTPADNLSRKLSGILCELRSELVDELREHEADLETIFDPYSFSPVAHELREKYLARLHLVQGLMQQLNGYRQGDRKQAVRVMSVAADSLPELVERLNTKLSSLNHSRVIDVHFAPPDDDLGWCALITYETAMAPGAPSGSNARM